MTAEESAGSRARVRLGWEGDMFWGQCGVLWEGRMHFGGEIYFGRARLWGSVDVLSQVRWMAGRGGWTGRLRRRRIRRSIGGTGGLPGGGDDDDEDDHGDGVDYDDDGDDDGEGDRDSGGGE